MTARQKHGMTRDNTAQDLCNELFSQIEAPMSDAWISDDACTDDPAEYLTFVQGSLWALEDAQKLIKKFLRKYRPKFSLEQRTDNDGKD